MYQNMIAMHNMANIMVAHNTTMQAAELYLFHKTAQDILQKWREVGCVVLLRVQKDNMVLTM
jgi:hypothetical protein